MSYAIVVNGHGVPAEDVRRIFEQTVQDLRAATPEQAAPGEATPTQPSGYATGVGGQGNQMSASDVELFSEETSSDWGGFTEIQEGGDKE